MRSTEITVVWCWSRGSGGMASARRNASPIFALSLTTTAFRTGDSENTKKNRLSNGFASPGNPTEPQPELSLASMGIRCPRKEAPCLSISTSTTERTLLTSNSIGTPCRVPPLLSVARTTTSRMSSASFPRVHRCTFSTLTDKLPEGESVYASKK